MDHQKYEKNHMILNVGSLLRLMQKLYTGSIQQALFVEGDLVIVTYAHFTTDSVNIECQTKFGNSCLNFYIGNKTSYDSMFEVVS